MHPFIIITISNIVLQFTYSGWQVWVITANVDPTVSESVRIVSETNT